MVENIEKVLERGEKLDLLVGKTDALSDTALHFRREARRLRTTMWWRVSMHGTVPRHGTSGAVRNRHAMVMCKSF